MLHCCRCFSVGRTLGRVRGAKGMPRRPHGPAVWILLLNITASPDVLRSAYDMGLEPSSIHWNRVVTSILHTYDWNTPSFACDPGWVNPLQGPN